MTLVVTGASGHLGRLVIERLLARGVPAAEVVAAARTVGRVEDLAARGVQVRAADYDDTDSLDAAFAGASAVLLVSGLEPDRVRQHTDAIEAAKRAGVGLLAYTSIVNADASTLRLAEDHKATEAVLRASGLPFVLLRNSWYFENYTAGLAATLEHGALLGSAGDGRVSAAARADYAEAAAAVLTGEGHAGRAYELGGDEALTLAELAAEIGAQAGRPVKYVDLPEAELAQTLAGFGIPAEMAAVLADADRGLSRGELRTDSGDLKRLIGRPTTSAKEAVAAALRALPSD
ncbi:MAG TPA: SDR family oxidoreductase [Actinospica sp.]|jgi:NAD(P)H dehydrogenase (quinone)|nr:SDR family oxidoreductase [Actinospica sp.]